MPSWMLSRLKRETQAQQAAADEVRLRPLRETSTLSGYTAYLARIYGFEAPIENAFLVTANLGQVVDLRWRMQVRLLKADLRALGVVDAGTLKMVSTPRFDSAVQALGWMYVIEQSAVIHGQLHRHFARWLPQQMTAAGCYLHGGTRAVGIRLNELGTALDAFAATHSIANKIVEAAGNAYRWQRMWFTDRQSPRVAQELTT